MWNPARFSNRVSHEVSLLGNDSWMAMDDLIACCAVFCVLFLESVDMLTVGKNTSLSTRQD